MHFADEPQRQRKAATQARYSVFNRRDVVGNLGDVVEGDLRNFVVLEQQQVGEGGLRALDLRRQQSLFADLHVEKERR